MLGDLKTYLAIEMSLNRKNTWQTLQGCQTRRRDMPINSGIQNFLQHGLIKTIFYPLFLREQNI